MREKEFIFYKIALIHARNFSHDKLLNIICAKTYLSVEPIFLKSVMLQETAEEPIHFPLCIKIGDNDGKYRVTDRSRTVFKKKVLGRFST